jgi:Asp-tRNA(Asn)/Glu-tRNA(Gln) amidotransferase A subunit family amidase
MTYLTERPSSELAQKIVSREVTSVGVVAESLRLIKDHALSRAFITVSVEDAIAATEADRQADEWHGGPLKGVPTAIKNLADTAGMRTTYGLKAFRSNVPNSDCVMVERLRTTIRSFPICPPTSPALKRAGRQSQIETSLRTRGALSINNVMLI